MDGKQRAVRDALIRKLHAAGHTHKQIAARAGCSPTTVYRVLNPGSMELHRQHSPAVSRQRRNGR